MVKTLTARRMTRVRSPAAPSLGVRQATADRGISVAVSTGCQHSKPAKLTPRHSGTKSSETYYCVIYMHVIYMIYMGSEATGRGVDTVLLSGQDFAEIQIYVALFSCLGRA